MFGGVPVMVVMLVIVIMPMMVVMIMVVVMMIMMIMAVMNLIILVFHERLELLAAHLFLVDLRLGNDEVDHFLLENRST